MKQNSIVHVSLNFGKYLYEETIENPMQASFDKLGGTKSTDFYYLSWTGRPSSSFLSGSSGSGFFVVFLYD
jgi:hypothetical protein